MQTGSTGSTWFYECLAWLELNKKRVLAGAVGVLVVFIAIYVYLYFRAQTELSAARSLMALRPAPATDDGVASLAASDLLKVAGEYPSTSAGERALLLAAGTLFADGKYTEAQAQFEKFGQAHRGSLLAPIAALGVASSLDALDKVDAALGAYQSVANQFQDDPVAVRARLAMAGLHEAKKQPEQAYRIYDEISKQPGAGNAVMEAAQRKDKLQKKYPQLAPTNAPSASATTTVKPLPAGGVTNVPPAAPPPTAPSTNR